MTAVDKSFKSCGKIPNHTFNLRTSDLIARYPFESSTLDKEFLHRRLTCITMGYIFSGLFSKVH